ncbi:hypothetical protein NX10_12975 [Pseudomonas fluorescens]|uniref:hypothetical protein n=1 Tax=Pseudomonas fluorescens group TaxID=136843 RepID=UPI0005859293|nr:MULTISPECIES: hypothetical protein [Pseudomonas fluorescens group]KIF61517.1 hypothetical protein NX10_12975 [Pseudomonas fluorescens]MDR7053959.1 hypothetical protein [Pseudomonas koreensis]
MKITPIILTTLLALGSTSAFAEGGAERMRYYYDNFPVQHSQSEQKADASAKEIRVPADQTAQVTESYRD